MIDLEDNDDEDMYFTPVASANLATLFNASMTPPSDATLTFKPPKQPCIKPSDTSSRSSKSKNQNSVLFFKEVHVFQLMNKEYSPLGKCGLALIGNEQSCTFQLLLYKQKNNIISTTKINKAFEFAKQKNNYITIKDDKKLTWTIHFNDESDLNEFSNTLSARCGCKKALQNENSVNKDIPSLKTPSAQSADPEHSNELNLKTLDPNMLSPSVTEPKEESQSTEATQSTNNSKIVNPSDLLQKSIDSDASDSSETTKKAEILSRVSKLGKKIINRSQNDVSDSDAEDMKNDSITTHLESKPNCASKPYVVVKEEKSLEKVLPPDSETNSPSQSAGHFIYGPSSNLSQMAPYQSNIRYPLYSTTQLSSDQLDLYFVENRTHNSEIRMNIMKLQNTIEHLMSQMKKTNLAGSFENCSQTNFSQDDITEQNKKLLETISENEKTIANLKKSYEISQKKNEELIRKDAEHSYEIANLTRETARCTYEEHKLNLKIKEQQDQLQSQSEKLTECEEKLNKMATIYCDCVHIKKQKLPEMKEAIKDQMNLFYNEVTGNFKSGAKFDGNDIKEILAPSIIDNTSKILNIIYELFM